MICAAVAGRQRFRHLLHRGRRLDGLRLRLQRVGLVSFTPTLALTLVLTLALTLTLTLTLP